MMSVAYDRHLSRIERIRAITAARRKPPPNLNQAFFPSDHVGFSDTDPAGFSSSKSNAPDKGAGDAAAGCDQGHGPAAVFNKNENVGSIWFPPAVEKVSNAGAVATEGVRPLRKRNAAAIALLDEWLSDDLGDDEDAWVRLKNRIEESRTSTRKRFSDVDAASTDDAEASLVSRKGLIGEAHLMAGCAVAWVLFVIAAVIWGAF